MGNADIDGIHLYLVTLLTDISDMIQRGIDASEQLASLAKLAKEHFEDEERMMYECDFPRTQLHIMAHEHISHIIELIGMIPALEFSRIEHRLEDLDDRLITHVEQYDIEFFDFYHAWKKKDSSICLI